jgi:hypothetical protein
MVHEDKVFQLKQYKNFPKRQASDPILEVFDTFEPASTKSQELNRKSREHFYVQDLPHEEVRLTQAQKRMLRSRFGLREYRYS